MNRQWESIICVLICAISFCFCINRMCKWAERTTWKEVEMQEAKSLMPIDTYWKGKYYGLAEKKEFEIEKIEAKKGL